jgi:hypothetical protein
MDFTDAITENTLRAVRFERPEHIPLENIKAIMDAME